MIRRTLVIAVFAAFASQANANPIVDRVTQQLADQGYSRFEVSRTFLGRIRIEAYANGSEREVIVNPRTGQILRDHWEDEDDDDLDRYAIQSGQDDEDVADDDEDHNTSDDDDHHDDHDDDDDDDGDDNDNDDDGSDDEDDDEDDS